VATFGHKSVNVSPHLSDLGLLAVDLDLLNEDYQEKSENGDDDQNRPKSEAKPWWSSVLHL
jgi:hypothetical protein